MTYIFRRVAPLAVDSRRRLAELMICNFYSVLTIDVHFAITLFAEYLLPFPVLNFPYKTRNFREFTARFRQSHDNLIGKHVGEAGGIRAEKEPRCSSSTLFIHDILSQ